MSIKHLRVVVFISLGFFFLAALLGALMRLFWVVEIPFLEYKHILHSHSHTALLGWAFTALAGSFVFFLIKDRARLLKLKKALIIHLIACLGMFLSFLYQGYGVVSIAFSTLTLLVIYYFSYQFLSVLKSEKSSLSKTFGRWAIYWLVISTAGLWSIAPVEAFLGKLHPAYFGSVQFFLHFQFNGWVTYGILALIFNHCEKKNIQIQLPRPAFALLQLSLMLTYTLSVTWSTPESYLFYMNSLGVILQVVAFGMIFYGIFRSNVNIFGQTKMSAVLLKLGVLSLIVKVLVQGAVAIPYIAEISYTIRNFVIGFIHLIMLGSFSLILLAFWIRYGIINRTNILKAGIALLIAGFVGTELLLFLQGLLLWAGKGFINEYYSLMLGITLLLPTALFFLLLITLKTIQKPTLP